VRRVRAVALREACSALFFLPASFLPPPCLLVRLSREEEKREEGRQVRTSLPEAEEAATSGISGGRELLGQGGTDAPKEVPAEAAKSAVHIAVAYGALQPRRLRHVFGYHARATRYGAALHEGYSIVTGDRRTAASALNS